MTGQTVYVVVHEFPPDGQPNSATTAVYTTREAAEEYAQQVRDCSIQPGAYVEEKTLKSEFNEADFTPAPSYV